MIGFAIKYRNIILPALVILGGLGAFWYYGQAQYTKGYDKAVAEFNLSEIETRKSDAQIWNEVRHENSKIIDIDAAADRLGILRPDSQL